jgi:hypothetical protein
MQYFLLAIVVILVIICFTRERLQNRPSNSYVRAAVQDLVDNNLPFSQFRMKYGYDIDSLSLAYLTDAYSKGGLSNEKIDEILLI